MSSTGNSTPEIDLNAINSEVAGMSKEALEAELVKFRVKQKKQQKKQQGSGAQKLYQQRRNATLKAMKEQAIKLGIWDELNEQAEKQAEAELAAEAEPDTEEVEA